MEIIGNGCSKTIIEEGSKTDFGRGIGSDNKDRTVSRRHVCFQLLKDEKNNDRNAKPRVHFEVIGKNPVWVNDTPSEEIKVFRQFEGGEMESGDMFCVSAKDPVWFSLKRLEVEGQDDHEAKRELGFEDELAEGLGDSCRFIGGSELELECLDIVNIDPVKEFGFLVIGHEFDCYPKKMIKDIKTWDWFLEENKEKSNSDDDDDDDGKRKIKKGRKGKRNKGEGLVDDDEWTGENEDHKELITKLRKVDGSKYSTRSKGPSRNIQSNHKSKNCQPKKTSHSNECNEDDDVTLGGFIVTDGEVEMEEGENELQDEEEELTEDEDEEE